MSTVVSDSSELARIRSMVDDLLKPSLAIYWTDFLISLTIGYGAAAIFLFAPLFSVQQVVSYIVAGFALHRVANFIHELAHLRTNRSMRSFWYGWNILAGIPMLMPSYFFDNHMAHHNARQYATREDCEYVALGRRSPWHILAFMSQIFVQPLLTVVRCLVLTPISFLSPGLRQWVLERASSFVFVFDCDRKISSRAPRRWWAFMDAMCFLRAAAIFVFVAIGFNPWQRIVQLYLLALLPLFLHYLRSLAAHRYMADGQKMAFSAQLQDSIDIVGDRYFFCELLFPIGLRYHALHHLFPSLPYHNLGTAHRRLMCELSVNHPYRQLVYPNFRTVLAELLRNSLSSEERSLERVEPAGRLRSAESANA